MKAACNECGAETRLTKTGTVYSHRDGSTTCTGSGQAPAPQFDALVRAAELVLGHPDAPEDVHNAALDQAQVPTQRQPPADEFDGFLDAEPPQSKWGLVKRLGRYRFPDPVTGGEPTWQRVTNLARMVADEYALNQWQQRMVARGIGLRPDLASLAATLDVKADKDRLEDVVKRAKDTAGANTASNWGTVVHALLEQVNGSGDIESAVDRVPEAQRGDVRAYLRSLSEHGIEVLPHLMERFTLVRSYEVAGKFDNIVRTPRGYMVADTKTGRDLEYGGGEIAVQLALYAHGVNTSGVWDAQREVWVPAGTGGVPRVREDVALVMHVPRGSSRCVPRLIDIGAGWEAARLCADVRAWRKRGRGLFSPVDWDTLTTYGTPVDWDAPEFSETPKSSVDGWHERFSAITTRAEGSALYQEARREFASDSEALKELVRVGKEALSQLDKA